MLELAGWLAVAGARASDLEVDVVVDNSEVNAPLFAGRPRPVAGELVAALRASVGPARVYHALPPGDREPGPWLFPLREDLEPCNGVERCRGGSGAHFGAPVRSLRASTEALRRDAPPTPRLEVYATALVEQDEAGCASEEALQQALDAIVTPPSGTSLDHLALGLVRVRVEPPPELAEGADPGAWWGRHGQLAEDADGCLGWADDVPWSSSEAPRTYALALIVAGLQTAPRAAEVAARLDGLVGALGDLEGVEVALVQLRAPQPPIRMVSGQWAVREDPLGLSPSLRLAVPRREALPCGEVTGEASLRSGVGAGSVPVAVRDIRGHCDGSVELTVPAVGLRRAFLDVAGWDPRRRALDLTGQVTLEADPAAPTAAIASMSALGEADRPLPRWQVAVDRLTDPGVVTPWSRQISIASLQVFGLDRRPWWEAGVAAVVVALGVGWGVLVAWVGLRTRVATRRLWRRDAAGPEPVVRRPVREILAEARDRGASGAGVRWATGVLLGVLLGVGAGWLVFALHEVSLG